MIRIHPWPYAADIAFTIRDDDLSYFTSPKQIEKIYGHAWNLGFKVSFATIPMHKGTNNPNVPPKYRDTGNYYPIYQNEVLVEYIKKKISENKVDLLQHGFCHTENSDLPLLKFDFENRNLSSLEGKSIDLVNYSEFYGASKENIISNIKKGKNILEETFGIPIKVFVSPQEFLTKPVWMAVWTNNMNYCGTIGRNIITQAPINNLNFLALLKACVSKLSNKSRLNEETIHITDVLTVPATYRHYWNKFTTDEFAEYWFDIFKNNFEEIRRKKGYFIILTHYWEYLYDWNDEITQKKQHEYLNKMLEYTNDYTNIWKCTVTELIDWLILKDNISIKISKDKIKIYSPFDIKGLSIKQEKMKICPINNNSFEIKKAKNDSYIVLNITAGQQIELKVEK